LVGLTVKRNGICQKEVHVKLELLRGLEVFWVSIVLILFFPFYTHAIFQHPDKQQVKQALERGVVFAREHRPPNELYWHFGSTKKFEPHGFLVTKISGLAVMSGHYALRGEQPTDQDIQQVLGEGALQAVVTVFGNSPGFAQDSYLLLKQNDRMIKPDRIRFDARARAVGHDQGESVFRAKIVGLFPYGAFDPESSAILLVFPGAGGEIRFDLDLSRIP
jgi:hypothetical protein